jgi:5'-nucleotidase
MGLMLKEEKKCHYVICLSHLGYNYDAKVCDTRLAAQTKNVDLILGGHSHTFLDQPVPFKNLEGKDVLVAQTGFAGLRLGRIDVLFDRIRSKVNAKGSAQINVS